MSTVHIFDSLDKIERVEWENGTRESAWARCRIEIIRSRRMAREISAVIGLREFAALKYRRISSVHVQNDFILFHFLPHPVHPLRLAFERNSQHGELGTFISGRVGAFFEGHKVEPNICNLIDV